MKLRIGKDSLFLAIMALSLVGCAKYLDRFSRQVGSTNVQISAGQNLLGISNLSSIVGGEGIMIYAVRNGDYFAKSLYLTDEFDSDIMTLPNGDYKFFAVGFDAANLAGGTPRCGLGYTVGGVAGDTVNLNGLDKNILFYIDSATCTTSGIFSDTAFKGANFNPLRFNFCSSTTNVSGKAFGNDCSVMQQSSNIFKSHAAADLAPPGESRFDISEDGEYIVYLADLYGDGLYNLITFSTDGTEQIRLNSNLANAGTSGSISGSIKGFAIAPDDTHVIYFGQENNNSIATNELYVASINAEGGTKISPITGPNSTLCDTGHANCAGVKDFIVFDSGSGVQKILYVAEVTNNTPAMNELFIVNMDGTNFKKLSIATLPASANGVKYNASLGEKPWYFDITPDFTKAIYVADQNTANQYELFAADINTANDGFRISDSTIAGSGQIKEFDITSNSQRVVFGADLAGAGLIKLYAVDISSINSGSGSGAVDAANMELSTAASDIFGLGMNYFKLAPSSTPTNNRVLYVYSTSGGFSKLRSVDSVGGSDVLLSTSAVSSGAYDGRYFSFNFSDDGTRVVYGASIATSGVADVYSNNVSGSANEVQLITVSSGTGAPYTASNGDHGFGPKFMPVTSGAQNDIVFVSNSVADSGTKHLYVATFAGANSATQLDSGTISAGRQVSSYEILNTNEIAYIADPSADTTIGVYRSYLTDLSASAPIDITPPLPSASHLVDGIMALSDSEFIQGFATTPSSMLKFYISDVYDTANISHTQISRLYSPTTYGRFQVSLLGYTGTLGGGISNDGPGVSSGCRTIEDFSSNVDGGFVETDIKIPAGSAIPMNPFVVAVDIYPRAVDCSGGYIRYLFPNGLANFSLSPQVVNVVGSASAQTQIFLQD